MIEQVWETRWLKLSEQLDELIKRFDKKQKTSNPFDRMDTFYVLAKSLKSFGESQFNFFKDGFSLGLLEFDDKFRPETSLAATLDQINFDIAAIQKAAHQRILGNELERKTLNVADFLTCEAIKPLPIKQEVEDAGIEDKETFVMREHSTVITYFQKTYSIRLMPYAPIVFIGIPLTCKRIFRDFLSIPHEVGHFVYRHSLIHPNLYNEIVDKNAGFVEWTKNWVEEIFADIYGTIISGPILGLSVQDLQMNYNIDDFFTGDGSHPVPVLRPYIHINTLAKLEDGKLSGWSSKLRDNWQCYLTRREPADKRFKFNSAGPEYFDETKINLKFRLKSNTSFFNVSQVISTEKIDMNSKKAMDIAINTIQGIILRSVQDAQWLQALEWPSVDEENAQSLLYEKFEIYIESLFEKTFPIDEFSINEKGIILVNKKSTNRKLGTTSSQEIEGTKETLSKLIESYDPNKKPTQISRINWLQVLYADGWTTKGPDCESTGGVCAG